MIVISIQIKVDLVANENIVKSDSKKPEGGEGQRDFDRPDLIDYFCLHSQNTRELVVSVPRQ
jgi:hypothetical protein